MPPGGHRHRLLLYTFMLNRWWRATLAIGLTMLIQAAGLGGLPLLLPRFPFLWVPDWKLWLFAGAGGFALLVTLFFFLIRKAAWVQPFEKHLRVVTPFMRLNISYRRFRQTYSADMLRLFPIKKARGWRRDVLEPLVGRTVFVIEMNAFPLPRWALRIFLSPLFFPDRTARLALLVPDWLALSTEVDGFFSTYQQALRPAIEQHSASGLLTGLKDRPQ